MVEFMQCTQPNMVSHVYETTAVRTFSLAMIMDARGVTQVHHHLLRLTVSWPSDCMQAAKGHPHLSCCIQCYVVPLATLALNHKN
jgi:hypothetical protein